MQHQHPFVRGIGDGTLDIEKFKVWVRQDYLFLIDYGHLLALAVARGPDLKTMTRLAELLTAVLETEMHLHRSYAGEFGIGHEELEREQKAPTTQGYTDFLLRVAGMGDFAELVAALLPVYRHGFLGQPGECIHAAGVSANARRTTAGARKPSRSINHCWF